MTNKLFAAARLAQHPPYRYPLIALNGAAGVLCFAPFECFWLAPLIWAGFFGWLQTARSTRQGALTGFAFGLGFFLTGVSWVYVSLSVFGQMPFWLAGLAALLFCTIFAGYPALAGWLFCRWPLPAGWRQILWFAALIAAIDWLRGWLFTGFPWLTLGYTQAPPSPLAGFAPLLGVHGLSLLTALSAAALWRWRIGLPLLLALAVTGQGLRQIEWTKAEGEPISVALIQGNVAQATKFRADAFINTLNSYLNLVEAHPAQLTLLPETALPTFLDLLPEDYLQALANLAKRQQGDLITGVVTGDNQYYFNSAVSLGSAPSQTYSKQHLVPFGELIPPGFDWFVRMAAIPLSSFTRGAATQPPLQVAGRSVAINICYEDAFGDEIIRAVPQAGILANLSNTAWFGDSLAQPQHLQIARLRAAEAGRPMLRATNTGMTAIIGAQGQLLGSLPPFQTGVLTGNIQAYHGLTPYVRWGDGLALILIGLLLALAHIRRPSR